VNAVDNPEYCDFYSGAVVRRGPLRIAISTSGRCPGIAGNIRMDIEERYKGSLGDFIETAGELRSYILTIQDGEKKNKALLWLCEKETYALFLHSGKEKVWEKLTEILSS
jgi:precorrin-2 dehydrogenase/sirohydrochlorin ferrochelatase